MRVILIASGERLQHGHCKKVKLTKSGVIYCEIKWLYVHTLVTMITLPYRNDMKDISHSHQSAMGTD